jgi:hypothetical protein
MISILHSRFANSEHDDRMARALIAYGRHHGIDLLLRVPILRTRIDRTPPRRSAPQPFGSQFSVAGKGIVVSELSPTGWADGKVLRRIFEAVISTNWAEIHGIQALIYILTENIPKLFAGRSATVLRS